VTGVPPDALAAFCARWKVAELALFGSVLRDDFGPDSDIDVLVRFEPHATLFDLGPMEHDLAGLFGRKVDLVERAAVENSRNYTRRNAVLASPKTICIVE